VIESSPPPPPPPLVIQSPPPPPPGNSCKAYTSNYTLIPTSSSINCSSCFTECNKNTNCSYYNWNNLGLVKWDNDICDYLVPPPPPINNLCRLFKTNNILIPSNADSCINCFTDCSNNLECIYYSWNNIGLIDKTNEKFCSYLIPPPPLSPSPLSICDLVKKYCN
jgi:hypothetical protein